MRACDIFEPVGPPDVAREAATLLMAMHRARRACERIVRSALTRVQQHQARSRPLSKPGGASAARMDPRDERIVQLEAEVADLRSKLGRAKGILVKLDNRVKEFKAQAAEPRRCDKCGKAADTHDDGQSTLTMIRESIRLDHAMKPPRAATPPGGASPRKWTLGGMRPAHAGPVNHLTELPFRVVVLLLAHLAPPQRAALAGVSREWARNVRLYRRNARRSAVSFGIYADEKRYAEQLDAALQLRPLLARHCTEAEVTQIYGNMSMLQSLSLLLRTDLRVRVVDWKPTGSVADSFLLLAQAMRMFSLYTSQLDAAIVTARRSRQMPEVAQAFGLLELDTGVSFEALLHQPVDRVSASERACVSAS